MNRHMTWATLTLLSVQVLACGSPVPEAGPNDSTDACVAEFEPGVDYYPVKADLRHAQYFSVTYHEHYKVLRSTMPATNWGPEVADLVVLNRCGTPPPSLEGELAGATVIETPVRRLASNSVASALRLRVLGHEDRIAAMPENVFDSTLATRVAGGDVHTISGHGAPGLEPLLVEGVDALVLFTSSLEHAGTVESARELGLGGLPLLSWAEPTYLGQAEWIKHHALLVEAEAEAEAFFDDVERRYHAAERRAEDLPGVRVLWATPTERGRWWVEAGNWQDEVLRAAGGINVFTAQEDESSIVLAVEQIVAAGEGVEVWITNDVAPSRLSGLAPLTDIAAWDSGRTWHVHRRSIESRNAFDWNETPLLRPDLVLEDLIAVLHPETSTNFEPRFFAPVVRGPSEREGG